MGKTAATNMPRDIMYHTDRPALSVDRRTTNHKMDYGPYIDISWLTHNSMRENLGNPAFNPI
jgi:hypothetical protein